MMHNVFRKYTIFSLLELTMTNNDILRRLRYALNLSDSEMVAIFKLSGHKIWPSALLDLLKKEGQAGYVDCRNDLLELFLDGLIIHRRGRRDNQAGPSARAATPLTNNSILKKLRIALDLKEGDMLAILEKANAHVSKAELSALFRRPGHRNYKACGDQFLRNFLQGLTVQYRG